MSTEPSFTTRFLGETVFSGAHTHLAQTGQSTFEGATAALETFYYSFNTRALEVLR